MCTRCRRAPLARRRGGGVDQARQVDREEQLAAMEAAGGNDKANEQLEFHVPKDCAAPGEGRGARSTARSTSRRSIEAKLFSAHNAPRDRTTDAAPMRAAARRRNSAFRAPSVAPELKKKPQSGMVEYVGILKMRALNADGMRAARQEYVCAAKLGAQSLKTGAAQGRAQGRGRWRSGAGRGTTAVLGRPRRAPPRRQPRQVGALRRRVLRHARRPAGAHPQDHRGASAARRRGRGRHVAVGLSVRQEAAAHPPPVHRRDRPRAQDRPSPPPSARSRRCRARRRRRASANRASPTPSTAGRRRGSRRQAPSPAASIPPTATSRA